MKNGNLFSNWNYSTHITPVLGDEGNIVEVDALPHHGIITMSANVACVCEKTIFHMNGRIILQWMNIPNTIEMMNNNKIDILFVFFLIITIYKFR